MANSVTFDHSVHGCSLFAFDLSPDMCNGFHFHPKKTGNIDITLSFRVDFAQPIYVIVMASYDAYVTIDKFGNTDVNVTS